jgi:hypothetical protein
VTRTVSTLLAIVLAAAMAWAGSATGAEQAERVHRLEKDGLKLELAPLGGDRVRAFFQARGFKPAEADLIARRGCVFRSAIGSAMTRQGEPIVSVSLPAWRVLPARLEARSPATRESWEEIWKARVVSDGAKTAFYWALFPTEQSFGPTDYNWGMLTFDLPPGTRFGLEVRWRTGTVSHSARLEKLECG